jgi:SAM-dependent methyltransferase
MEVPAPRLGVVTDNGLAGGPEGLPEIDTNVPSVARIYDYLLGGTENFAVDRAAAERAYAAWPGGIEGVRADVRAHRALLGRVIRYLAAEAGIRQFLDIGTGIPKENNTHEVAQRVAPQARVVYVDHDPSVLAQAGQLLTSTPEGACAYIFGELRQPGAILAKAADTLDFTKPVAIVLFGVLHLFPDADRPAEVVATLLEALAPGSYLALSHLARDVAADALGETFGRLNRAMPESVVLRTHDEVARFFDGLDLVDPGVVQQYEWRPEPGGAAPSRPSPLWCAVGRKP